MEVKLPSVVFPSYMTFDVFRVSRGEDHGALGVIDFQTLGASASRLDLRGYAADSAGPA